MISRKQMETLFDKIQELIDECADEAIVETAPFAEMHQALRDWIEEELVEPAKAPPAKKKSPAAKKK